MCTQCVSVSDEQPTQQFLLKANSCNVHCASCERVVLGKSAKVPSARVRKEFVRHIVEDEVDGQEERQDDKREDGQQREQSGVNEENQTHNMSAWR